MTDDGWRCGFGGKRKDNGNCEVVDPDDGLPVQGVREWGADKHDRLRRYIDATWAARSHFLPAGRGGAAYIDLFAGPGRVRERGQKESHDGSPLIALGHTRAPFSRVVLCDLDPENIATLKARTAAHAERTTLIAGDSNERIDEVVSAIPRRGLNVAFIDPFAPSVLRWATFARLADFDRMDMIVNFPTGFIKRNFHTERFRERIDAMLGDDAWRREVTDASDCHQLIEQLRGRLATVGYGRDQTRSLPITNTSNVVMFHLVFFSKHDLGDKIWNSIAKTTPSGQRGFGF